MTRIWLPLLLALILLPAWASLSRGADYLQVPGVVDVRSVFSDGDCDVETLVELSRQRGIGAVVLNDHDLMVMEYGVPPLRNLLKRREERNSILKQGADRYLQAVRQAGKRYPDMVVIPGSLSTAFYYWTGNPLRGDLTAHNHERRILTVGMESPGDYEDLPVIHNSRSVRLLLRDLPGLMLLSAALIAALAMLFRPGRLRIAGIIVLTLALLFIINSNRFRSSPHDAYHGDQGMAPYRLLIDHVNARGGMTFWNYPETRSGVGRLGPIRVSTRPYPEVLLESRGYTGFSALYGDDVRLTEPGGVWDMALKEHCRGFRDRPAWGIATADFHREGGGGEKLGNYQTVFLVREKTRADVLEAMRRGRMYARQGKYPRLPRLDEFSVAVADGTAPVLSGEEATIRGNPRIRIALSSEQPLPGTAKVRLIRGGEVIRTAEGPLPLSIEHEDSGLTPGEKTYYRMDLRGAGTIVSNPIFLNTVK